MSSDIGRNELCVVNVSLKVRKILEENRNFVGNDSNSR